MEYKEGNCGERRHPLTTPEILEHILSFCEPRDLKACRLTSRFWMSASKKPWRASATVNLERIESWKLRDHVQETSQGNNYYSNYIVSGIHDVSSIQEFWRVCGPNIKVLELNNYYCIYAQSVRDILYDFTGNLTELKLGRLIVGCVSSPVQEPNELCKNWNLKSLTFLSSYIRNPGVSFTEILSHFPGLQTLIVEVEDGKFDDLFESLSILRRNNPTKLKLKHISGLRPKFPTSFEIVPGLLEVVTDPTLHFKSISIGVNWDQAGESLARIFQANGNSLEKLELERRAPRDSLLDPSNIFDQPEISFDNLIVIVLRTRVYSNLSFIKFTPNLTKLSVSIYGNENCDIIRETIKVSMNGVRLERFREFAFNMFLSVEEIRKLSGWMPNLERLSLPLRNKTFLFVCQHWNRLSWLHIPAGLGMITD